MNYLIAFVHFTLLEVQSLQKSNPNANIKGFMQGLVRKVLKQNMWKYEVNCAHIHHGELGQNSFSSCKQKSHIQSNELVSGYLSVYPVAVMIKDSTLHFWILQMTFGHRFILLSMVLGKAMAVLFS